MALLRTLGRFPGLCRWLRTRTLRWSQGLDVDLGALRLAHPVGLAAGLDKNAEAVNGLFALGFAAVEVGTLTPRPQSGNPPPRLFRLPRHQALINRMGFNNRGVAEASVRLAESRPIRAGAVGVNVGKNKDTPLENAAADYLACLDALGALGDYVVVNLSSPNTPGLRQLQEPEALRGLLAAVRGRLNQVASEKPLFLKIAPDLGSEAIDAVVDVALEARVDGLIATNTTITRPVSGPHAEQSGGLSGRPLSGMSTAVVRRAYARARGKLPIVGVGGVFDAEDLYAKLKAGASFVQLYTGFVYQGPAVVGQLLRELRHLMDRDGYSTVRDVVGADHRI